jgi:hypothetical protein
MSARETRNKRLVLPVVLAGTFMAILDVAIVNIAIPSIRKAPPLARSSWWSPRTR